MLPRQDSDRSNIGEDSSNASFRPLIFGEVLFDHFPDGARVPGGAPFNVAWHLQGFKAHPLLISGVGADAAGDELLDRMARWGMDPRVFNCITNILLAGLWRSSKMAPPLSG